MDEITTEEASRRLGVSARRVRALASAGELRETRRVGRSILLDAQSVDLWSRFRGESSTGGRPWSPAVTWGAIVVLSGGHPGWLTPPQARRLRIALAGLSAEALISKSRRRAKIRTFAGLNKPSDLVVRTGGYALEDESAAAAFGLVAGPGAWDGYCAREDLDAVVEELDLYSSVRPDHTLRVVDDRQWLDAAIASPRLVLIALDLAESAFARERSAGIRAVEEALERV